MCSKAVGVPTPLQGVSQSQVRGHTQGTPGLPVTVLTPAQVREQLRPAPAATLTHAHGFHPRVGTRCPTSH